MNDRANIVGFIYIRNTPSRPHLCWKHSRTDGWWCRWEACMQTMFIKSAGGNLPTMQMWHPLHVEVVFHLLCGRRSSSVGAQVSPSIDGDGVKWSPFIVIFNLRGFFLCSVACWNSSYSGEESRQLFALFFYFLWHLFIGLRPMHAKMEVKERGISVYQKIVVVGVTDARSTTSSGPTECHL